MQGSNCAHFPDNLNLAAQFVSLVSILGVQGPYLVPILLKSGSLFGPYFKAQRCSKMSGQCRIYTEDDKSCLCLSPVPTDQNCTCYLLKVPGCLVARNPYHKCNNDVDSDNGMERDGNPMIPKGNIAILP